MTSGVSPKKTNMLGEQIRDPDVRIPCGYPLLVYLVQFNHGSSSGSLKTKKAKSKTE